MWILNTKFDGNIVCKAHWVSGASSASTGVQGRERRQEDQPLGEKYGSQRSTSWGSQGTRSSKMHL